MIQDLYNLIKWLLIGNNPNWSYPPSISPSASHNYITILSHHSNHFLRSYSRSQFFRFSNWRWLDCALSQSNIESEGLIELAEEHFWKYLRTFCWECGDDQFFWLHGRYDTFKPLHTNIFIEHVTTTCSCYKQLGRRPRSMYEKFYFHQFFLFFENFVRNEVKLTNWVKYSREESKFKFKSTLCNIPVLLRHR